MLLGHFVMDELELLDEWVLQERAQFGSWCEQILSAFFILRVLLLRFGSEVARCSDLVELVVEVPQICPTSNQPSPLFLQPLMRSLQG